MDIKRLRSLKFKPMRNHGSRYWIDRTGSVYDLTRKTFVIATPANGYHDYPFVALIIGGQRRRFEVPRLVAIYWSDKKVSPTVRIGLKDPSAPIIPENLEFIERHVYASNPTHRRSSLGSDFVNWNGDAIYC